MLMADMYKRIPEKLTGPGLQPELRQRYVDNGDGTWSLATAPSYAILPTGAATAALQTAGNTKLDTLIAATGGGSYATRIDDTTTSGMIYIGNATIGSSGASAVWQVKRLNTNSIALDKRWADGDASYDNIWDNRASLTYS